MSAFVAGPPLASGSAPRALGWSRAVSRCSLRGVSLERPSARSTSSASSTQRFEGQQRPLFEVVARMRSSENDGAAPAAGAAGERHAFGAKLRRSDSPPPRTTAVETLRSIVESDRSDFGWAKACVKLGGIEARRGAFEEAEGIFRLGLFRQPKNPFLLQALGVFLTRQRRLDEARECFKRGIEANRGNLGALYQSWALLEISAGAAAEARSLFEKGVRAEPEHGAIWSAWALAERDLGDVRKAQEIFIRALTQANPPACWCAYAAVAKHPTYAALHNAWAQLEEECGNGARARSSTPPHSRSHRRGAAEGRTCGAGRRWRCSSSPPTTPPPAAASSARPDAGRAQALEQVAGGGTRKHSGTAAGVLHAWANCEQARETFPRALGGLLKTRKLGNLKRARRLYEKAASAEPSNGPTAAAAAAAASEAAEAGPSSSAAPPSAAVPEPGEGRDPPRRAACLYQALGVLQASSILFYSRLL
eukprot:tig00020816_g14204.t1